MHRVWGIERQLEGQQPTGGVADNVRPLDAQMAHQRPAVGGLLREADRTHYRAAARATNAMVGE